MFLTFFSSLFAFNFSVVISLLAYSFTTYLILVISFHLFVTPIREQCIHYEPKLEYIYDDVMTFKRKKNYINKSFFLVNIIAVNNINTVSKNPEMEKFTHFFYILNVFSNFSSHTTSKTHKYIRNPKKC